MQKTGIANLLRKTTGFPKNDKKMTHRLTQSQMVEGGVQQHPQGQHAKLVFVHRITNRW